MHAREERRKESAEGHCEVAIQDGGYPDSGIHGGAVWREVLSKAAQFSRKEKNLAEVSYYHGLIYLYFHFTPKEAEVGLTCHMQEEN